MTVAEYAKHKGVSKQSVYDKLRRGTLSYEIKDGIKHIVETPAKSVEGVVAYGTDKKLKKTLKKLDKVKHKLALAVNEIEYLNSLLAAKDSEIDTLKRSSSLLYAAIENKLLAPPEEVVTVPVKKRKKKKK